MDCRVTRSSYSMATAITVEDPRTESGEPFTRSLISKVVSFQHESDEKLS